MLREAWTGEEHLPVKTAEYLWDVQKRLELGQLLMTKNDEKAKEKRKKLYDRRADDDPFIEGEEVLVRLPAEPKGIAEQWRGPFRILEKTSPVTYRISAPLRGVPGRNFHRNSLKRFVREVAATVMVADGSLDDSGQLELVPHPTTPQPLPAQADVSSQPGNPEDRWTGTCCDIDCRKEGGTSWLMCFNNLTVCSQIHQEELTSSLALFTSLLTFPFPFPLTEFLRGGGNRSRRRLKDYWNWR